MDHRMAMAELDKRVALALGWANPKEWAYPSCRIYEDGSLWMTPPRSSGSFATTQPPKFSTDPAQVGPLLLEAQRRGWDITVGIHDGQWSCEIVIKDKFCNWKLADSFCEAICLAFVEAAEVSK